MHTWLTILVSWPLPDGPMRVKAREKAMATGRTQSNTDSSPPHMTVSRPFWAPPWPPETGASMKGTPWALATA